MRLCAPSRIVLPVLCAGGAIAANFPFETIQLTDADVLNHTEIQFGNASLPRPNVACRSYPGDASWPSSSTWDSFNKTLGGALIKPLPPGAPCYAGTSFNKLQCTLVQALSRNSNFHSNDPISVVLSWTQGNTCLPTNVANGTCTMGGFPVMVVNATTVKHIQLAVNFARNNNIRLVIKNSGHDFIGRSLGGGALSIWTHNIKGVDYLPSYSIGQYTGKAVKYAAGTMSSELSAAANKFNVTLIAAGGSTVGVAGGFLQGGGHSGLTSYYGLASDQVLSVQLVTADGRFVTADPNTNTDLFYAIRGGGGGTYGVVTSVIVKALPRGDQASSSIFFATGGNSTISNESFWEGVAAYHRHVVRLVDAGAIGYNFLRPGPNGTLSFQNSITMPGMTAAQLYNFTLPLTKDLNEAGIPMANPQPFGSGAVAPRPPTTRPPPAPTGSPSTRSKAQLAEPPGNEIGTRMLATRLLPRENFEDTNLFEQTMAAIREFVEVGGYTFHGINYSPTVDVAGWPGNTSSINPHFRRTVTHAEAYDSENANKITSKAEMKARHDRFNEFFQPWRDLSPTAGSYQNEADVMEPNWQWAFFGENYPRLLRIKQKTDPWGVFYATTAVGSEYWQVQGAEQLKTQDGKLCKLARPSTSWREPDGWNDSNGWGWGSRRKQFKTPLDNEQLVERRATRPRAVRKQH